MNKLFQTYNKGILLIILAIYGCSANSTENPKSAIESPVVLPSNTPISTLLPTKTVHQSDQTRSTPSATTSVTPSITTTGTPTTTKEPEIYSVSVPDELRLAGIAILGKYSTGQIIELDLNHQAAQKFYTSRNCIAKNQATALCYKDGELILFRRETRESLSLTHNVYFTWDWLKQSDRLFFYSGNTEDQVTLNAYDFISMKSTALISLNIRKGSESFPIPSDDGTFIVGVDWITSDKPQFIVVDTNNQEEYFIEDENIFLPTYNIAWKPGNHIAAIGNLDFIPHAGTLCFSNLLLYDVNLKKVMAIFQSKPNTCYDDMFLYRSSPWSPNGMQISLFLDGKELALIDVEADTQEFYPLSESIITLSTWAPDSKHLIYSTNENEIFVFSLEHKKSFKLEIGSEINFRFDYMIWIKSE
jgi:hypothetical protein